jgi:hypothetical protein
VGTWGTGAFDDDAACDWAYGLEGQTSLTLVASAIDRVLAVGADDLELDDAVEGVAAAEVVARLLGRPGALNAYTATVDAWVARVGILPSAALAEKARRVVLRVRQAPSELLDVWSETSDLPAWLAAMADLEARLAGQAG